MFITRIESYLFKKILKAFGLLAPMFIMLLTIVMLFGTLWQYLGAGMPLVEIMRASIYYIPQAVARALPFIMTFCGSYAVGVFSSGGELIAAISMGVSVWQILRPFFFFGVVITFVLFAFSERVIPHTDRLRNTIITKYTESNDYESQSIRLESGILFTEKFDKRQNIMIQPSIILIDKQNRFFMRIDAASAQWQVDQWILTHARIFYADPAYSPIVRPLMSWKGPDPEIFSNIVDSNFVNLKSLRMRVDRLKKMGMDYKSEQLAYYRHFTDPIVCLIVTFFPLIMRRRLRHHTLIFSLAQSIALAVIYYVLQMIAQTLTGANRIPPLAAALLPPSVFLIFVLSAALTREIHRFTHFIATRVRGKASVSR